MRALKIQMWNACSPLLGLLTPDSFLFCCALYRERGREYLPYGLGHELAIQLPIIHHIVVPLGAVRASHQNAHRLFAAGKKVLVYLNAGLPGSHLPWGLPADYIDIGA